MSVARLRDGHIVLPGIATAHSHAFQRALRGRTQRSSAQGSFWSWRALMYEYAESLTPERIYEMSRRAYRELFMHGVRAVGEFHYVHHQADGTPYEDRTLMAASVTRAARDEGLRVCLLRVIYERGGFEQPLDSVQKRFSDGRLDDALEDIEALQKRFAGDANVRIGVAPHSVRAVSAPWIREAHAFASQRKLPFHMHVAEQVREVEECMNEHNGKTPVTLLGELGVLDERFVAVHATHLSASEADLLGKSRSFACICRTTERDLGDGLPNIAKLRDGGARFCLGTDSHAISCPFEEARALELDERTRTQSRHAGLSATELLHASTYEGYEALGFDASGADQAAVHLDATDIGLEGFDPQQLDEAVVYGASRSAVIASQKLLQARHA